MRYVWGSAFVLVLSSALAACAPEGPAPAYSDAATGNAGAPSLDDQSPRFIGVIGTRAQHAPPFLGVPETNFYCLRSFLDRKTGETEHQLYVSDSYHGAERHWNSAHDAMGHALRFIEIGRSEITCEEGCSYLEEFAATIPESELRANPQGMAVIFSSASRDQKQILVSGAQISAQLAAVDTKHNRVWPAAAAATARSLPAHQ
jgi:hypothetical protein